MHKNCFSPAYENQVGLSRQIFAMETEPEPKLVRQPPNDHLRCSAFGSYCAHIGASAFGRQLIHYSSLFDLSCTPEQIDFSFVPRSVGKEFTIAEFETEAMHQRTIGF